MACVLDGRLRMAELEGGGVDGRWEMGGVR